ncbi:MAG: type IV-A pilus assembly ATPase PilB [Proteobacteria bacterium]|nr:MAG: type IV-A pilus assembly ATPase PilB [Pseudomonadota bacterium]
MATVNPSANLGGLARRLVQDSSLSEQDARKAHEQALRHKTHFVTYIVENKLVSASTVAATASHEFGVPLFDLGALDISSAPIQLVSEKLIRKHHSLPLFKRGNRLFIGVSDPTNLRALDEIKFHTALVAEPILVEEDKLSKAIETSLDAQDTGMSDLLDSDLDNLDISTGEGEQHDANVTEADVEDAPVVRFVNKVLLDAIKKGASDIHFEPYEKYYRVRFRQDGILYEIASPPINLAMRLAARIKVMSRLDVSERRVPQDGRIKMKLSKNRAIDFRVSTCPTLWGEKVVLRILDPASAQIGIDALGFEPDQRELFLSAIHKPYGMVLVTGPTGSGKTVTLYTAVNILNQSDVNISTCEDPVEINLAGVNQVNVDERTGMTFTKALKAFLRQDPDIILVGEIRDIETGEIGVKAAQTGHLVLSTLHTNDAPQTLTRLVNMGIPPFNIASSVHLIVAQRLARRLCNTCKEADDIPREALLEEGFTEDQLKGLTVYKPVGCDQCTNGYKGRVGIYQVMPVSEETGRLIMEGGNSMQIADQAQREGYRDLRQSGLLKVVQGVTSLAEVNRVTKE